MADLTNKQPDAAETKTPAAADTTRIEAQPAKKKYTHLQRVQAKAIYNFARRKKEADDAREFRDSLENGTFDPDSIVLGIGVKKG
jgi:hypothetical protein